MANLLSIPQTKTVQGNMSLGASYGCLPQNKTVGKNDDGSIYDCTNLTGLSVRIPQPTLTSPQATVGVAVTMDANDATGVTWSLDASQFNSLLSNWFSTQTIIPYSLIGQTASDTIVLGNGSIAISVNQ